MYLQLLPLFLLPLAHTTHAAPPSQGFDDATIAKIEANMLQISTHSWELGAAAEALTELNVPSLSVFGTFTRLPPRQQLSAVTRDAAADVFNLATRIVREKPANSSTLIDGDGAAGDPASLGVAVALTGWTRTNRSDTSFDAAVSQQLDHILHQVPRYTNGAISHREDQVQLWDDFVFMVPPFIAYQGALSSGVLQLSLLEEAYNQCKAYREVLHDDSGLWQHIQLGTGLLDATHWGTGNAWAAAGMLRVLETIRRTDVEFAFKREQEDLVNWVTEIISSTWPRQQTNGTLLNVIDDPTSFADTSSTALLAAATYRLATITNNRSWIPNADRAFQLIKSSVDADGWLLNTVDPLTFHSPSAPGTHSPEGQTFTILLHTAWRDWQRHIGALG